MWPSIVALWVKLLPVIPVSDMITALNPSCFTADPAGRYWPEKNSRKWSKCLGLWLTHEDSAEKLLFPAWPSPGPLQSSGD